MVEQRRSEHMQSRKWTDREGPEIKWEKEQQHIKKLDKSNGRINGAM